MFRNHTKRRRNAWGNGYVLKQRYGCKEIIEIWFNPRYQMTTHVATVDTNFPLSSTPLERICSIIDCSTTFERFLTSSTCGPRPGPRPVLAVHVHSQYLRSTCVQVQCMFKRERKIGGCSVVFFLRSCHVVSPNPVESNPRPNLSVDNRRILSCFENDVSASRRFSLQPYFNKTKTCYTQLLYPK